MIEFLSPERAAYAFATRSHGWDGFAVVDLHGVEAISEPFRYVLTVVRRAGDPLPLEALLDADATLAMRGRRERGFYLRHGIVEEAEEIDNTDDFVFYRVHLVPAALRGRYRHRCRSFVDKTLREIVSAVLRNTSTRHPNGFEGLTEETSDRGNPQHVPAPAGPVQPDAAFRWDIRDSVTASRLDDLVLRRFTVQYNENDFDFVARLLEEEGIAYFFEHDAKGTTMWLCDEPGKQSLFNEQSKPDEVLFRRLTGALVNHDSDSVFAFADAMRMRSRAVTMRDWSYARAHMLLEGQADANSGDEDRAGHFEFPGRDDTRQNDPCVHPANVRLGRFATEQNLSEGRANIRGLAAGRRIVMADHPGPGDGYLLTRLETVAVQFERSGTALEHERFGFEGRTPRDQRSFETRFSALRGDVRFRPAMRTPKPRIDGVQSAVVTQEQGSWTSPPEIHSDAAGRVRVRFPWDQRDDGTASSRWLRVSQYWAGAGFGALYTPRVGQEVLIAFVGGDPDRPTVVGRVYNARNPLPIPNYEQHLEQSTIRSHSSPEASGHNEIFFEDKAGHECLRIHAQKDMREIVLHNHRVNVHHDERITVGGAQSISVGGDQTMTVGGNQQNAVEHNHSHVVRGDHLDDVIGDITTHSGRNHRDYAMANREIRATNFYVMTGPGQDGMDGDIQLKSATATWWQQQSFEVHVGTAFIRVLPGVIELDNGAGCSIRLIGGTMKIEAAATMTATAALIDLNP